MTQIKKITGAGARQWLLESTKIQFNLWPNFKKKKKKTVPVPVSDWHWLLESTKREKDIDRKIV